MNDGVAFLWRWELAGHPRETEAWRMMHDYAVGAYPRPGAAFSDMHIALAQAVMDNDPARQDCARQMAELAREGRYPSGPTAFPRYRAPSPRSSGAISPP